MNAQDAASPPSSPNERERPLRLALRSMLFVPGDSERKLAKAESVPADALVVDLEDSVDAPRKEAARALSVEFIQNRSSLRARSLWIRINAANDVNFADDVAAAVRARADGVVLPGALLVREAELARDEQSHLRGVSDQR